MGYRFQRGHAKGDAGDTVDKGRIPKLIAGLVVASAMVFTMAPAVATADEIDLTPGPTIIKDENSPTVVMTSLALFIGAVVVLALASSLPWMIAAAVLMGFGYGAAHPMLQSIALGATPRERRAIAGNTLYFGIDVAYLTMPAVGGAVVTALSGAGGLSEPQSYSALLLGLTIPIVVAAITFRRVAPFAPLTVARHGPDSSAAGRTGGSDRVRTRPGND